jgi:hypothetical protein
MQQQLVQRQDVDLDDISASINRIGQVGLYLTVPRAWSPAVTVGT